MREHVAPAFKGAGRGEILFSCTAVWAESGELQIDQSSLGAPQGGQKGPNMTHEAAMTGQDRGVEATPRGIVEFWRPLIWSAIAGGTVTALGCQLILTLIGIGVGASIADPVGDSTDGRALGTTAIVWLIVSGIISFGAGGWVAGHMSGVLRSGSGAMHGMTAWALAAVFGATVAALAGSPVLGGAAAGIGQSRSAVSTSSISGVTNRDMLPDGTVRLTDRYGRPMTPVEAEGVVENARRAVAQASLWTGFAFLISLGAASAGGMLGRTTPGDVRQSREHARRTGQGHPAL